MALFRTAVVLAAVLLAAFPARAQIGSHRYAAIVVDARSGQTLVAANPDEPRHPASLTKMMTVYMVFEAVRDGRLAMNRRLVMSEEAASRPPSKLGLPPGATITVEHAVLAVLTRSANDVAALLGETLGGTEHRFAQMMTLRARALGMTRTTFRNASGLPDIEQVTTARDMALLGRRLIQDFPQHYHLFGTQRAQVAGSWLRNHNRMLDSYDGADGIKTGFIRDSGFNIVTSARRDEVRLVAAVFGGSSWVERDQHTAAILDQGFAQLGVGARAAASPALVSRAEAAPARPAARPVQRPPAASAAPQQASRAAARPPTRTARATPAPAARPAAPAARSGQPAQRVAQARRLEPQGDARDPRRTARAAPPPQPRR
jgi:D-alanyl-D-alanine carboxypeptidase